MQKNRNKTVRYEEPTLTPMDLLQEYATGQYLPDEPPPPSAPDGSPNGGAGTGGAEGNGPNNSTPPWP